jgi:hypothetical protein
MRLLLLHVSHGRGLCANSVEHYYIDFSLVRVKLRTTKNTWSRGIEPRTSALIPSWKSSTSVSPTVKLK